MNPDKLFDYLDGKLSGGERERLEQQLASDPELQRELGMARRIHGGMTGESREVILEEPNLDAARGRQIVKRVGIIFIVLLGVNVVAGLLVIARHEATNPNRKLLENQMREQLSKSLDQAARANLSPAPLGVDEITIAAAPGQLATVADQVVAVASRLGGSAIKELPDNHSIGVLVDISAEREQEFRNGLAVMTGAVPSPSSAGPNGGSTADKKSFVIHIREPGAEQH